MIPISIPSLTRVERTYVNEALESTWISSTGRFIDLFERAFALGVAHCEHALSVTNGTAALHLALAALGVGPGDEVIVPSLTYIATANAVRYVGAEPVFADVEADSWCIDPESVASLIGPRTVGVIAVHLYGHPADMGLLNAIARRHSLWVIEDAAEAPFATYHGQRIGGLADIGTFSFYGNKVLSSGEGGAVTTNSDELADRMRLLRGQGMDPSRRYYFPVVGFNYRMTNVAAAILVGQLERHEEILEERRRVYQGYTDALQHIAGVGLQPQREWATISPWLFCVTMDPSERANRMARMAVEGVETRPFFIPIHSLPPYLDSKRGELPVTERVAAAGLNLPTYPGLSDRDVKQVVAALLQDH